MLTSNICEKNLVFLVKTHHVLPNEVFLKQRFHLVAIQTLLQTKITFLYPFPRFMQLSNFPTYISTSFKHKGVPDLVKELSNQTDRGDTYWYHILVK